MEPVAARTLELTLAQLPPGAEADLRLLEQRWGTMRFANGGIHQPHLETCADLSVRVYWDGRLATATTADLRPEGLAAVVREAAALARVAPKEPRFPGFSDGDGHAVRSVPYSASTAAIPPREQVRLAEKAIRGARDAAEGSRISGAVNFGWEQLSVANSSGLRASTRRSLVEASVLVEQPTADPPVSGWAEAAHWDAARLDLGQLGREAAQRMARTPPESLRPGAYRVVLSGTAVAELASMLGYLGFGGHAEEEGWSCLRGHRGKKRFPTEITLTDDGRSRESLPQGIDYEGQPKSATALITEGIVGDPVTDLVTAGRLGRGTTGHALPPESPSGDWGPVPTNLLITPGSAKTSELIRETRRGVLVTRFHYVRVVHPGKAIITGMTRDGTYRIDKGEIAAPVKNLRFTESVIEALRHCELVGADRRRFSGEHGFSTVTAPAILTGRFRFTSATLF